MQNILETNLLSKNYGSFQALKNISIAIPQGSIVGLLGPNGSGKTTLMKIIAGLLTNYEGSVKINGLDPGAQANNFISYLPDKQHIPEWLNVQESIQIFQDFYKDFSSTMATDMIKSLNLPLNKKIKSLSKGMKEKLQLSLIMSRQTKLYILDEPIAAVDPASRDFIMDTILNSCSEGSSLLISTHIITDIEPSLDRAIFLKSGEVILEEDVETIRMQNNKSLDQVFREVFKC